MCLQKIHEIWHLCKSTAFTNENISRWYAKILEIPEGSRRKLLGCFYKIQRERGHGVNPFHGGGMDIFLALHNIIIGKKSTYPSQLVEVQGDLPLLVHQQSAKAMQSYFTNMNHKIIHC